MILFQTPKISNAKRASINESDSFKEFDSSTEHDFLEQSRDPRHDVWSVRADGGGEPRRLIEFAGSPAVAHK
jgi:hypothetical protein